MPDASYLHKAAKSHIYASTTTRMHCEASFIDNKRDALERWILWTPVVPLVSRVPYQLSCSCVFSSVFFPLSSSAFPHSFPQFCTRRLCSSCKISLDCVFVVLDPCFYCLPFVFRSSLVHKAHILLPLLALLEFVFGYILLHLHFALCTSSANINELGGEVIQSI